MQAAAAEEHRPTIDILRKAVERYLETLRTHGGSVANAEKGIAAAAQLRDLRKGNILPEGLTIRDLINEGRA